MPGKADYEELKELGAGSFGVVHLARKKGSKTQCVLKQVILANLKGNKQKTQALNEAKIMKQLACPYIVQYLDAFVERDCLYLVLQLCALGDLKLYLKNHVVAKKRPLKEDQTWRIFLKMMFGMEYLHTRKILHRDLKSENIFLTSEDGVRIGDLGLSKMLTNTATGASTLCGTPRYLSPEEISNTGTGYNEKADVWALGIILYELCSENHAGPWDDASKIKDLLHKIANETPTPSWGKHLSDAVLPEIVDRLMKKKPEQRASIQDVLSMPEVVERGTKYGIAELTSQGVGLTSQASVAGLSPMAVQNASHFASHHSMARAGTEVPDGFCSRICGFLGRASGDEMSTCGERFHRMGHCEICTLQGSPNAAFTVSNRRHHCRVCGKSICQAHCWGEAKLEGFARPQRICEICNLLPSGEAERGTRILVLATCEGDSVYAWDYDLANDQNAPWMWRQGEAMRWAGYGQSSGRQVVATLEFHPGSPLVLCDLLSGREVSSLPIPGQGDKPEPRASASAPAVRPMKVAASRSPSGSLSTVEFCAMSGSWFCVVTKERDSQCIRVLELPHGQLVGTSTRIGKSDSIITAIAVQHGKDGDGFVVNAEGPKGSIRVWGMPAGPDSKNLELRSHLTGHIKEVVSIAIGVNAKFICTGSLDGNVCLWSCKKRDGQWQANDPVSKCDDFKAPLKGDAAVCCDGNLVAFVQAPRLASKENGASVWDLVLGKWVRSFYKRGHNVTMVALCGSMLASSDQPPQCIVQLWHVTTGQVLSSITSPHAVSRICLVDIDAGSSIASAVRASRTSADGAASSAQPSS